MHYVDDIPKYKKKKRKNTPRKANHKHVYENCVFQYDSITFDKGHGIISESKLSIGKYCPICGKIGTLFDADWMIETHRWNGTFFSEWTEAANKQFNEESRTLPFFRVYGMCPKRIDGHKQADA